MHINIYTGNHSKTIPLDDTILILSKILRARKINFSISIELNPDSINIILDDFSDYERSKKIIDFKRDTPKALILIIATEHKEEKYLVSTFNFFSGEIRDAAVISLLNIYYRISIKHFNYPTPRDLVVAVLYSPIVILDYLLNIIKFTTLKKIGFFYKRPRKFAYMLQRYIGFEKMVNYADSVILLNNKDAASANVSVDKPIIGTLYPEIDVDDIKKNIFKNKDLFFEVTGTITQYRLNKMQEINDDISDLNLQNSFLNCKDFPHGGIHEISKLVSKKKIKRGAYSLHPPQTETWKYASPGRIYRALCIDYNMPILTKKFNEHPIEDICFIYDDKEKLFQFRDYYFNIEKFLPIIESKIEKYMLITNEHNNKFLDKLSALSLSKNLESQKV
jgi:hypothetical protein